MMERAENSSTEEAGKIEDASALLRRLISHDTERVPAPVAGKNSPASSFGAADQNGTKCSPSPTPPAGAPTETANPCGEETGTVSDCARPASGADDGIQVTPEASQSEAEKAATDTAAQENSSGSDVGALSEITITEASCREVGLTSDTSAQTPESSRLLGDMFQIRQGVASDLALFVTGKPGI